MEKTLGSGLVIYPVQNGSFPSPSCRILTREMADKLYLNINGGQTLSLTESFAAGLATNEIFPYGEPDTDLNFTTTGCANFAGCVDVPTTLKTNTIAPSGDPDEPLNFETTGLVEFSGDVNVPLGSTYKVNNVDLVADQTGNTDKYLRTDGTSTYWQTLDPARLRVSTTVDQNTGIINDTLFVKPTYDLYLRQDYPTVPTDTNTDPFTGTPTVLTDPTDATINTTIAGLNNGDILQINLTADVNLTTTITINKQIKFIGPGKTSPYRFVRSTTGLNTLFSITASGVWIQDCRIEYTGNFNASVEACISVNYTGFNHVTIKNCKFGVNEFGVVIAKSNSFTIDNCLFEYQGTTLSSNTHRFIALYGTNSGTTSFITNNTYNPYIFPPSTTTSRFIYHSEGGGNTVKGTIVVQNNTPTNSNQLNQFYLRDSLSQPVQFYIDNNVWTSSNGNFILYGTTPLTNTPFVYLSNNVCTTTTGLTTGLVRIDSPSATTFGTIGTFFFNNNTITGTFDPSWASGAQNGSTLVGYRISLITPPATLIDTTLVGYWDYEAQYDAGISLNGYPDTLSYKCGPSSVVNGTNLGGTIYGGVYETRTLWTDVGTTHTFLATSYRINPNNDNITGIVTIYTINKTGNGVGVYQGYLAKRVGNNLALTQISKNQTGITTFTISTNVNQIVVTTDANCSCALRFDGAI